MAKKVTIKVLEERIAVLSYNVNQCRMMIDNLGFAVSKYIDFNGNTDEFKKHLENTENVDKLKENVENDAKWYRYNTKIKRLSIQFVQRRHCEIKRYKIRMSHM